MPHDKKNKSLGVTSPAAPLGIDPLFNAIGSIFGAGDEGTAKQLGRLTYPRLDPTVADNSAHHIANIEAATEKLGAPLALLSGVLTEGLENMQAQTNISPGSRRDTSLDLLANILGSQVGSDPKGAARTRLRDSGAERLNAFNRLIENGQIDPYEIQRMLVGDAGTAFMTGQTPLSYLMNGLQLPGKDELSPMDQWAANVRHGGRAMTFMDDLLGRLPPGPTVHESKGVMNPGTSHLSQLGGGVEGVMKIIMDLFTRPRDSRNKITKPTEATGPRG